MHGFERLSIGIGDRFGRQGPAQLRALLLASEKGVALTPVWNKSSREHTLIGTQPVDTRRAADKAVRVAGWTKAYFLDADHIGRETVTPFIPQCNFFTLDVAEFIGKPAPPEDLEAVVRDFKRYSGRIPIPGLTPPLEAQETDWRRLALAYLAAVQEAGRIYRQVEGALGQGTFITEISMDETAQPQGPLEVFFILVALARERIPVQTIAPRFSGRFNKGVDYVGDPAVFEREFAADVAVIDYVAKEFRLPRDLKISVHSGSDKFSLYAPMRRVLKATGAGLHLKTAGTTWLEELIGLALSGTEGLALVRQIYTRALQRIDEFCRPYALVVEIDRYKLPSLATLGKWSGEEFAAALRHNPRSPHFNPHLRQLLHVSYKVAAELGEVYLRALDQNRELIGQNVTWNLFERHIRPLFLEEE